LPPIFLGLIVLGFLIGAYGTIIGVGGGFILVPVLLSIYPDESPEIITSISLAVVFFNSLSGSIAYGRLKRIDYRAGLIFSAATIPGAILGSLTTSWFPRDTFEIIFGVLMLVVSLMLILNPTAKKPTSITVGDQSSQAAELESQVVSKHWLMGSILSTVLGYISNLMGVGAGFLFVPTLVYFLRFPVQTATATSQFILAITAFAGTVTHIAAGLFHHGIRRTIALAIGVIIGAQVGARFSGGLKDQWIIRSLALALALVGIKLSFWRSFSHFFTWPG
jgi:uncharacterized protein